MTRTIRLHTRPQSRRASLVGSSALAGLALALATSAYALPTGGEVVAGGAGVSGAAGGMIVTQSTQNAVINWQTFGIGQGEAVSFVQPNATSVALNRVLGADPSAILGKLSANGRVFIVNPNGVLFGAGAQVNVAGLVASTLNISDADVMAGRYSFAGAGGSVTNLGAINADGGFVALLGGEVTNQGLVSARLGTVALAAGEAVTLDFKGDGLLNVSVDRGAVGALVRNGGMIRADGGQVMLSARSAGGLLKTVVNNTGAIEARTLDTRGGVIRLLGDGGLVQVTGALDATGRAEGQRGGTIVVTGQAVEIDHARLDGSGYAGGGTVRVGGGYQGRDADVANAQSVSFGRDATIAVDAIRSGDGGTAIVWSNGETTMLGAIDARGGALSGNGGFVETSGQHVVTGATSRVTTLAANGKAGLWLLDPVNYVIAGAAGDETGAQVALSLAASDRLITATNDITVSDVISWATPHNLTLNAGHDITVSSAVTASAPGAQFILIGGHDVTVSGAVTNSTVGGKLLFTAGNDLTVSGATTASASGALIDLRAGHNVTQSAAITSSGGGRIVITGDNDGTGGTGGGTVILSTPAQVIASTLKIFYSPQNGYASPNNYAGANPGGTFTAQMWAFATAANKVYDGTTAATLTFVGDPTAGGANDVRVGGSASFADKNVGNFKAVNFGGATLSGTDAPLFALYGGGGSSTASITPATLVITANNAAKTYGQVVTFASGAFTSVGLVGGETIGSVSESSAGAAASANAAGSPYAITASGASGGTFSLANYTTTYVSGLLTVAQAGLVVTPNSFTKDYGETLTFTNQQFTATGLINGDTIGAVTIGSAGGAPTASVAGGPYLVTASNAVGGTYVPGNYAISYGTGTVTVVPVSLVVTANNATKTYGDTATFAPSAFTLSGLRNGDTATSAIESSAGAAASAAVAGSPYAIAISNLSGGTYTASNYVTTYVNGALTVTPASLVVTASNLSKEYGQALAFTGQEFTSSGLKNGDTIAGVTIASAGGAPTAGVAAGPYVVTASNATGGTYVASNYATTYVNGALTVTPASLVVTASNLSKDYGQALAFTGHEFTSSGLKNGDTIAGVTIASAGGAPTAGVAAGPYVVTASNAIGGTYVASNYATTYVSGLLTVAPASLLVTPNSFTKDYGQTLTFTGQQFTASGLKNGDAIGAVTIASAGGAATAGVAAGPYLVTASNAAGGSYVPTNYAVSYGSGTVTVVPVALVVTANNATKTYGDTTTFAPSAFIVSGLRNGETATSATESSAGAIATATVAGGPYAIAVSNLAGGTYTPSNYVTSYVPGALVVTPAALVITANDATKPYLQTLTFTGHEFTTNGLRNGETVNSVSITSPGATAAAVPASTPYAINASGASGGSFSPSNYSTTYRAGALTVTAPGSVATAGGQALGSLASYTGLTQDGRNVGTTVPTATQVREARQESQRQAIDGAGAGLAQSVAGPAGVNLAVAGDGVRMPNYQLAQSPQIQTAPAQTVIERASQRPAETAPVRARKQDRN